MGLVESAEATSASLKQYAPVFVELCNRGKTPVAEALAWTAVEAVAERGSHADALDLASSYLLAIGDSEELRKQVAEEFRKAHSDVEGVDELLREAGLAGGRPVRRALRTLEVCLAVKEGDYLAAREEDGAAQITSIDRTNWSFKIENQAGAETLGAVHLADRFRAASATDFHVLKHLDVAAFRRRMEDEPVELVADLCRRRGGRLDSDELEAFCVPSVFDDQEWKKWWSKARSNLKKCSNLRVEGRTPVTLTYVDAPVSYGEEMLADLLRHRDPAARYDIVQRHLRECAVRGQEADKAVLVRCSEELGKQAAELRRRNEPTAGLVAVMSWRVGQRSDAVDGRAEAVRILAMAKDVAAVFARIGDGDLVDLACEALAEARPGEWRSLLVGLLPTLPQGACDRAVKRLLAADCAIAELEAVVPRILGSPLTCFEALLWLWDGPADAVLARAASPLTVLNRVLRALQDVARGEVASKEQAKTICQRARSVLSARNYERFQKCLEGIDPGVALSLRTQVNLLDNLGPAVRSDLLNRLSPFLPKRDTAPAIKSWDRDDVLYTTEAGLARKQNEVEFHVNVKMRENAKAIGAAAEKGDLSENSEYKFALEERDLLRARLAQMNAEVQEARVMTRSDVTTDEIGIGTRAVFRRVTDGERYEICFVGPWDADHSKGWFNYKAPLAKSVMGKRIGDVIEFEHSGASGRYEVVELHNGLADDTAA